MNKNENFNGGGTAMQTLAFGYKCQECGQGRVLEKVFPKYKTKVKGYPLTVENARVGVCDLCGAEHFDPNETMRWRTLLEEQQSESYLRPTEIRDLRKQLGLSMEQFAILLGCTRQSLYNWERSDRPSPQSRMADLFMRLTRESHLVGPIDVLSFLKTKAEKLGFDLVLSPKAKPNAPIIVFARKIPINQLSSEAHRPLALAADTEPQQEAIVLVTDDNTPIARLSYDYQDAALNLVFLHTVPFVEFDAEIQFKDGKQTPGEHATIINQEAPLLTRTTHTEEDVAQVRLLPHDRLSSSDGK
jgi:putative zinc finger/helix-turn-helix YgiT family protein